MDLISLLLASIIDKFKTKNPKTWGLIAVVLLIAQYAIVQGNAYGLFPIEGILKDILQGIVTIVGILVGSRTTQILAEGTEKNPSTDSESGTEKVKNPPIKIENESDIQYFVVPKIQKNLQNDDALPPKTPRVHTRPKPKQ